MFDVGSVTLNCPKPGIIGLARQHRPLPIVKIEIRQGRTGNFRFVAIAVIDIYDLHTAFAD
jgi:hypothetical protein